MNTTPNKTTVEDILVNVNKFDRDMKWTYTVLGYLQYFTSTIQLATGILVIFANIFLIIVFCKNPKLRTNTNKLILHYAIWHLICTTFASAFVHFMKIISLTNQIPMLIFYIVFEIDKLSLLLTYLFAMGLAVDWLFTIYNFKLQQRFNMVYKYLIFIIYLFSFVYFVVQFALLLTNFWFFRRIINEVLYFSILLFFIFINYLFYKNKSYEDNYKSYALSIANIIIFFWLPLKIYRYLLNYSHGYYILHSVFVLTAWIPEWFYYSTNIVIIIMLRKLDTQFGNAYSLTFKKRENNSKDFVENKLYEIADDDEEFEANEMQSQESIYI